jgi:hypothetical protein
MKRTIVTLTVAGALALGLIAMARPAQAKTCVDDSLSAVDGDGAILTMISGSIWKVDDVDRVDSGLWLGAEDVLICSETISLPGGRATSVYTIINKEEGGEEVSATRLGHKG